MLAIIVIYNRWTKSEIKVGVLVYISVAEPLMLAIVYIYNRWTKSEIKVSVLVYMLAIVYIYQVRDQGCSSLHAGHCLHLPSQRSRLVF